MRKQSMNIKRAVCIMANELRKTGLTLSEAFKKAWRRIKKSMTIRATGTTHENRQERLQFLRLLPFDSLKVLLRRDYNNQYDANAIAIVIEITTMSKYTVIGYVPRALANELAKVMDKGVEVKAELISIIGGYGVKENLGALINIVVQGDRTAATL